MKQYGNEGSLKMYQAISADNQVQRGEGGPKIKVPQIFQKHFRFGNFEIR